MSAEQASHVPDGAWRQDPVGPEAHMSQAAQARQHGSFLIPRVASKPGFQGSIDPLLVIGSVASTRPPMGLPPGADSAAR
jgi:hypothetical protein